MLVVLPRGSFSNACAAETHIHTPKKNPLGVSDLVDARMDAARNQFLLASLCMSIASLSLTAMSCVGGIFGMNLHSGIEEAPGMFVRVTYGTITGSVLLGLAIFATMVRTGVITGIGPVDRDGIESMF